MSTTTFRGRSLAAALSLGVLATFQGTLLAPVPATASPPAAAIVVDARTAALTVRPSGLPAPGAAPARQLSSARVTQDLVRKRIRASVVLRGVPTAATNAQLQVEFGHVEGTTCVGDRNLNSPTASNLTAGFSRSGATIRLDRSVPDAGYQDWDCAVVGLTTASGTTNYDVLVGELHDVLAKPKLRITEVRVLRTKVSTVGLVRNVWGVLNVTIANAGRVPAPATRLVGSGRGLRVRAVSVGRVYDGSTVTARIRVKLTGTKRTRLRLVTRSGQVVATRAVAVKRVAAPKRPIAGLYQSRNGRVRFRIKAGRVVGFYTRQWTTCGGYPDFPTTSWTSYDFPRTLIPRSGLVDARQRHRLFTAGLQMKVVGKRVTRAHFSYAGPNRCRAGGNFAVRRVRG